MRPLGDGEVGRDSHRLWGIALGAVAAIAVCAAVAGAAGVGNLPTGVPPGGGPTYDGSLTRILRPSTDALVRNGHLTVRVRSRVSLRGLHVLLNGHGITRRLRKVGGVYTAGLGLESPLRPGTNLLTVSTRSGGHFDFDHASVVVARPVSGLVTLESVRVGSGDAPVKVSGRVKARAAVRASLNGRRIDGSFTTRLGRLVGLLGGHEGVRPGSNRLVITAYTSAGRHAHETTISRHFLIPRFNLIASAGPDHTVVVGQLANLNGTRSQLAPGATRKSFRWQIVSAPRGSKATLLHPTSDRPGLIPDLPGTYRIRLKFGAQPGPGALRGRSESRAIRQSTDTITFSVGPNAPYGVPLETFADQGAIKLNGSALSGTAHPETGAIGFAYAVIDRSTLQPVPGAYGAQGLCGSCMDLLIDTARKYSDGYHLFVLNWKGPLDAGSRLRDRFADLYKALTGATLPSDALKTGGNYLPGSIVAIPGAPAGGAFFDHRDRLEHPVSGDMTGYLRPNLVTNRVDFVFTDQVPVDTQSGETSTTTTTTVGSQSYTGTHPEGASGFHLLRLDPKTLAPYADFTYVTNTKEGPSQSEQNRLANDLQFSAENEPERPLVILQSYGTPTGYSTDWDRAAKAIEKMGGTRQVFDDLNQPQLDGADPEQGRTGGYAFIGRTGSTAPRAEVSYPLDGLPARLEGLLMRSRTADYEPMVVGPALPSGQPPVNTELVRITNQPPTPYPPLAPDAQPSQVQRAQNFLGGPDVMKVCPLGVTCDVRRTYVTNYDGTWATIATALQNAATKCQEPHTGFSPDVCETVRSQLFDEVQAGNRVRHYLGPLGLQQPFGAAGVAALANLGQINNEIQEAVKPPPADNTTSNVLNIISYATKIFSLAGPQAAAVAGGLGAVFGLAGYLTKRNSAPNLIGPQVQTAASNLGVTLAERYQTAGDQLADIGRIIVSDPAKLEAVAGKVDSDPNWILDLPKSKDDLIRAGKQTISEGLIPTAYPFLYDLGNPFRHQAREWNCYFGSGATKHDYLFGNEPDGGQVGERFPTTNWNPVMGIGAKRIQGEGTDARIPTPPGSVMDPLFTSDGLGGLGMKKLEFFSPRLFQGFPAEPGPKAFPSVGVWFPSPSVESPKCIYRPMFPELGWTD